MMKTKFASARNLTIWYLENLRIYVTFMQAEEGTRMDISVSVPPSDTCSTSEKGQGNYSLFLPPARDSTVIPIGSSHSTAAHENQKNLILQLELLLSLQHMKTRR
ncbi:uncharacterized protein LOC9300354 [Arabidopsis lyrata subsp. lyrata]|uniref:uncharacterized protein LOC9300354 n=1 Tax=Arabidopsis lyrata subsp. lyrata TaxID=81972 RepID=UPI000A29E6BE|nr:uncharacterized protein LOC9300354 [Arabidopsis lyrata subsp. lyrata]|eukprot:XP_020881866.1 uncharacterized protein LOC9300354 [Arabidopsis lyrata subsp. lyrata]